MLFCGESERERLEKKKRTMDPPPPLFINPTRARAPPQTARQQRSAQRYTARRAGSGPAYGQFGMPTHVDRRGREYRPTEDPTILLCRHRIRRRTPRQRRRGTPLGGRTGAPPGLPGSRTGGQWTPRWPQPGDDLVLFRVRDQVLEAGKVESVFTMPRSSTTQITLTNAGLYMASEGGGPVSDPAPYLAWISGDGMDGGGGASTAGGVRRRGRLAAIPAAPTRSFPAPTAESL